MFDSQLFAGSPIPVLEQTVLFAGKRHALLAGNIANLDTPGYRAKDVSPAQFEARLRKAIDARRQSPHSLNEVAHRSDPVREVRNDFESMVRHDDGNVVLEDQVKEISKNQQRHNVAIALLTSQFRLMQAAISERV
ncbi:MAG: flagellar basal body rod protein FlgB [Pirellulales bacterium]|nr:flagellar basal body rod protein FlgB [Pirellulales bacterium]